MRVSSFYLIKKEKGKEGKKRKKSVKHSIMTKQLAVTNITMEQIIIWELIICSGNHSQNHTHTHVPCCYLY